MPVSEMNSTLCAQMETNLCTAIAGMLGPMMIFPVPVPVAPISTAVSASPSVIMMLTAAVICIAPDTALSLDTPGCFACIPAAAVPLVLRAPPVVLVDGHAGLRLHHCALQAMALA